MKVRLLNLIFRFCKFALPVLRPLRTLYRGQARLLSASWNSLSVHWLRLLYNCFLIFNFCVLLLPPLPRVSSKGLSSEPQELLTHDSDGWPAAGLLLEVFMALPALDNLPVVGVWPTTQNKGPWAGRPGSLVQ